MDPRARLADPHRQDETHVHVARCCREPVFRELGLLDGFASIHLDLGDTSSWNRNRLRGLNLC